jgi:hypothetical protein
MDGAVIGIEDLTADSSDGREEACFSLRLFFLRTSLTLRVANFFFSRTQQLQTRFQNSSNFFVVE